MFPKRAFSDSERDQMLETMDRLGIDDLQVLKCHECRWQYRWHYTDVGVECENGHEASVGDADFYTVTRKGLE